MTTKHSGTSATTHIHLADGLEQSVFMKVDKTDCANWLSIYYKENNHEHELFTVFMKPEMMRAFLVSVIETAGKELYKFTPALADAEI